MPPSMEIERGLLPLKLTMLNQANVHHSDEQLKFAFHHYLKSNTVPGRYSAPRPTSADTWKMPR